jgi:DNA topoisomerase-1
VLDRLVGYKLSPLLWQKIRRGLSAGRVQSAALRLIVDREEEIEKFQPKEYWLIRAHLEKPDETPRFLADLYAVEGKRLSKFSIKNKEEVERLKEEILEKDFKVIKVKEKDVLKSPPPPFITSTLQQEAHRLLRFSAKKTMMLAQMLYEAGYITYMRTDSLHLSAQAISAARKIIEKEFGEQFLSLAPRQFKSTSKLTQEAHEAIRPSDFEILAEDIDLNKDAARLYDLIWRRTLASQMSEAKVKETEVFIEAGRFSFLAKGEVMQFLGFLKLYLTESDVEEGIANKKLPPLKEGDKLSLLELITKQNFSQPPPRYSEATLIKALEKEGIGRPSTYAPIISTLIERGYVEIKDGKLFPQEVGKVVTQLLKEHFAEIVDLKFTARMENDLDEIASGQKEWQAVVASFYFPFAKKLDDKKETIKKEDFIETTDEACPLCGIGKKVIRFGRFGRFYACSRFPECDYSEGMQNSSESKEKNSQQVAKKCPNCGGFLLERKSHFGKFLGCSNFPKCNYVEALPKKSFGKCPSCGSNLILRKTKKGRIFYGCANFPNCNYASWQKPDES